MTVPFTNADWAAILPVGIVAVTALVVLLADLLSGPNQSRYVSIAIALAGTIGAGVVAGGQFGHDYNAFFGGFITGGFATVFEEIVLIGTAGAVLLYGAIGPAQRTAGTTAIMLWSACGAMLMAGAANLIDDLSRARAALARPLRALRHGRSQSPRASPRSNT